MVPVDQPFASGSDQAGEAAGLVGTVLAVQANYYRVQLDENHQPKTLLCTRRSRLKKIGQKVMVGDRVRIEEPDWLGQRGAIAQVFPRQSELDRPPIANADQILLVFALAEPELEPWQLSRFLVKAESIGLQVQLGLNKQDLVSGEVQTHWHDRLLQWGYQPLLFSIYQNQGLEALMPLLADRLTIIAGPSGVGKSSLIQHLIPHLELRTGAVSGKLGRGRHTTRHVELFELAGGGLLADSPGFNQPELNCAVTELVHYFPEARQRLATGICQFSDCLHGTEPDCKVRGDWERYEHYLTLLQEVQTLQQTREQTRDPEATLKAKMTEEGQVHYEPRLAQKKYRQQSRRSGRQSLQGFKGSPTDWLDAETEEED